MHHVIAMAKNIDIQIPSFVFGLIDKYYERGSPSYRILLTHSILVTRKALQVAERMKRLHPDIPFILEASMLHDIGICKTNAPGLGCHGKDPYITHIIHGRKMLEKEGYPKHGLVCERHTGVGLPKAYIIKQGFPLPKRDMVPTTTEERIVSYADSFYSKDPSCLFHEKSVEEIAAFLSQFGARFGKTFLRWAKEFGDA